MLVLSRKLNESIVVADGIVVTVIEIRGDKVRLGIVADNQVPVHRQEVWARINGKPSPLPIPERMTRVCSWCRAAGEPDIIEQGGPVETHGICERHKSEQIAEVKRLRDTTGG